MSMLRTFSKWMGYRAAPPGPVGADYWRDPANYRRSWTRRTIAVSPWLADYRAVCDLGCGPRQALRAALPAHAVYLPADLESWTPDTEVCDLNQGAYPERALEHADVCVMLGVMERLHQPAEALAELARRVPALIFSYHPSERSRAAGWANSHSSAEMAAMLADAGLRIADLKRYGERELLFHTKRRETNPMSILSKEADGLGFYWAYYGDDHRQINVRHERDGWVLYVGGDRIGVRETKSDAEAAAIEWIRAHPPEDE